MLQLHQWLISVWLVRNRKLLYGSCCNDGETRCSCVLASLLLLLASENYFHAGCSSVLGLGWACPLQLPVTVDGSGQVGSSCLTGQTDLEAAACISATIWHCRHPFRSSLPEFWIWWVRASLWWSDLTALNLMIECEMVAGNAKCRALQLYKPAHAHSPLPCLSILSWWVIMKKLKVAKAPSYLCAEIPSFSLMFLLLSTHSNWWCDF